MEELLNICQTMLDNADLDISLEILTSIITLDFVVGGSRENVILRCSNYTRLQVVKDMDDCDCFFIGETNVELITSRAKLLALYKEDGWLINNIDDWKTRPMFRVRCEGAIMLDIVCGALAWKLDDSSFQSLPTPAELEA